MSSQAGFQALVAEIGADGVVSAEEALRVRKGVFPDGVVSAEEIEALMSLNARVSNRDAAWAGAYEEALVDFVLANNGVVDGKMTSWVMSTFTANGCELDALNKILMRAEWVQYELRAFARAKIAATVHGRALDETDVERIRLCLFAGDNAVTEDEARWLFEIDAESDGRANAASWSDLFVRAQLCHLMGRQAPGDADAKRQRWLAPPEKFEPLSNLKSIFKGGFQGYASAFRETNLFKSAGRSVAEAVEEDYEAANAQTESDTQLTPAERAWTASEAQKDGKLTANELALLTALKDVTGG